MLVPAWPPGPPLSIPTTTALVLTLPIAAAHEGEKNVSAPLPTITAARVSAITAPGSTDVHVLVIPDGTDRAEAQAAETVFDQTCTGSLAETQLTLRELRADLDDFRSFLWMCARNLIAPKDVPSTNSQLMSKRGFARLTAACDMDNNLDDDYPGTYFASVSESAPWSSLPELPTLQTRRASSPEGPERGTLARRRTVIVGSLAPLDFASLQDLNSFSNISENRSSCNASPRVTTALSCVRSHIFLGGSVAAKLPASTLRAKRITTIINLAAGAVLNAHSSEFEYLSFHAHDAEDEDLMAILPDILDAISRAKSMGGAALVHCYRGISRSAAAAAAALMHEEGMGCAKALREVSSARPIAGPNLGFVQTLQKLEEIFEGHGERRVTVLAPLRNDRVDGGGQEVLREAQGHEASDPFAVVLMERAEGQGMLVARAPLVDERRWKRGLWLAKWIERRNEISARRAGRQIPPQLRMVALFADNDDAREVRDALAERRLAAFCTS